jgi:hypothetical protein
MNLKPTSAVPALLAGFVVAAAPSCAAPSDDAESSGAALTQTAGIQTVTMLPSMDIGSNPTMTSDTFTSPNLWKNVAQSPTSANDAQSIRNHWASYKAASYTCGFSGGPSGAVSAVDVTYRAKVDSSGTIQVSLYDGTSLLATGPKRSLTKTATSYTDTYTALSASSANNLRVRIDLAMPSAQYAFVSSIQIKASTGTCTPTTCAAQVKNCGAISDGCGGTLACGTCGGGQTCSSSNVCTTISDGGDAGSDGGDGGDGGALVSAGLTCNLLTNTNPYSAPAVGKPGYLASITDPVFGTKITRITGDPGTAISSGGTWGSDVHHEYSKVQAWNADQSLLLIETNHEGGSGPVFLDGHTYQPLFSRHYPGNEPRWHPTDPNIMVYAGGSEIGYWSPRTDTKTVLANLAGYTGLGIGPWEGNLSLDGSKMVANGVDPSGRTVFFAFDLVNKIKSPDILLSSIGSYLDWASISPNGDYVVAEVDDDMTFVMDTNGNRVMTFAKAHPSHYDMTIDKNGDEVAVGKAVGSPYDGHVIKVRLRDGAMTSLTTGGYARHSSTRDTALRGMVVSSFEPNSPPYSDEIGLINLDGNAVYRVAHHYDLETDYEAEVIPSISPDGTRVIFASNWGSSTGRPVQVFIADLTSACTRSP